MPEVRHAFKVMTYEVDFAGVVSNIVYVRWLEDLRNLLAEQTLPLSTLLERGVAPVLTRTEVEYLAPATLGDTIDGRMWMEEAGRARFILAAEFRSRVKGEVTVRARQVGVFVSRPSGRPVPLPVEYRL